MAKQKQRVHLGLGVIAPMVWLLGGCAVQASHQSLPETDPALLQQLSAPVQAGAVAGQESPRWWQTFADTELDRLVAEALTHNRDLGAARARLDAELARLQIAQDQLRPQGGVSAGADISRRQWSGEGSLATRKQINVGVSARWQLDLFGRIHAAIRGAEARLDQRLYAHEQVMAEVVSAVVDSYVQLAGVERQLVVLEQQLTAIDASVNTLEARVSEGLATPLELYRSKALRHEYRARQPLLQEQQSIYRSTLATLTGRTAPELRLETGAFALPRADALQATLSHPDQALLNTPELLRARARVGEAVALSDQAKAALYPEISVSGVIGWLSGGNLQLSDGDQQLGISPQLSWSLLNLSALRAGLDAAQEEERAALLDYEQTLLQVLNRADRSLNSWTARSRRLDQISQRHRFAFSAFDQARVRYEEGAIPYMDFLDAQRDLLDSEDATVRTQTAWVRAYANLYSAFSGHWIAALKEQSI